MNQIVKQKTVKKKQEFAAINRVFLADLIASRLDEEMTSFDAANVALEILENLNYLAVDLVEEEANQ